MSLKAVLFDLDGVLVDTAKYHCVAWKELADQYGIPFDETFNERLKGVSRMASLNLILEQSDTTYSDDEKLAMATAKNEQYVRMVKKITPAEILPGATGLLRELQDTGIQSAVCSASRNAGMIIDLLELNPYFDAVLGGADVTKPKPDPEIFERVRDRFGLVSAECLVIEDGFAGVAAAKAAGMKVLGIGEESILSNADVVYRDMTCFSLADARTLFE